MKRTIKKMVGALLCLALFLQLFSFTGIDLTGIKADEYVYEEVEYAEDGCGYSGTKLVSVPSDLKSVTVKEGTTVIGASAFSYHENLESVVLPESVTDIEERAFEYTKNLKSIYLPKKLKTIGKSAFYGSGLESITIPKGVKVISYAAFEYMKSLNEVIFLGTVTDIENSAFSGDTNLKKLSLKKGLINIGNYAFSSTAISSLRIPSTVQSVGAGAFEGITGKVTVAKSCKALKVYKKGIYSGDYSVLKYFPKDLTKFTIHPKCTKFEWGVFYGSKIKEITIPDGVEDLYAYTFEECENLESVKLGKGLKNLRPGVFCDCPNLKSITVDKKNKTYCSYEGCVYTLDKKTLIYFPEGLKEVKMHKDCTAFRNNNISSAYYNTVVICSSDIEDIENLDFEDLKEKDAVKFVAKAGTKTAYGLAKGNGRYYYSLSDDENVLDLVKAGKTKLKVTQNTVAEAEIDLGCLYKVEKASDIKTNAACTIKWESSKPKVASVSKDGMITGLKAGKTTITATITLQNKKTKKINFEVEVAAGKFKKGDIVKLGSYEQDGNEKNGKEPILWQVLDANKKDAFLVSVDVLEYKSIDGENWEKSEIRKWLNGEFLKNSFTSAEKKLIKETTLKNSQYQDGGTFIDQKNTKDKIFLLSLEEVSNPDYGFCSQYMYQEDSDAVYADINRRSSSSKYVQNVSENPGSSYYKTASGKNSVSYVLRTLSYYSGNFVYVTSDGSVSGYGSSSSYNQNIRPALHISQQ